MKELSRWSLALGVVLTGFLLVQAQEKDKNTGKEKEVEATLVVKVEEDAILTIDGVEMKKTGKVRKFSTPALKPGKRYQYTVVATWEPNNYTKITRTRKAIVEAGKTSELDMNKEDPKQPDKIVIRYVPTPQAVVDAMLKLGKVGKEDVVYDLGCGDGRIVVTAVKKFGAKKGVGIDLDPQRIKESKANAKEADVESKVDFRLGDVMKVKDLENATVVCLYLGDELNEQLRPILQKRLKPGSRIVSHRFLMGDWKPEKTVPLEVGLSKIEVHLWTIKAKDDKEKDDKGEKGKKDKD